MTCPLLLDILCHPFTLMKLDNKFNIQKRKVAMVLDNCSAHNHVAGLIAKKLFFLHQHHLSDLAIGSRHHLKF